ncbi:ATP-binding protein [Geobacter argillaceus]|uniref:histidine kinase n=1 Tax=Geobacter argillaceus TaxID=345631 RepID=A0A562WQC8_9BACT|nr:ATP-binding protein [Geobacter argillaceus]TWJ32529.1 phospho-acceptor domain-containing protein [Geobacter argillaceus]
MLSFRFPIRAKMLVAFIGLALVPMLFLGLLVTRRAERLLGDRVAQELSIEVATAADTIEVYLAGARRDVLSLARFLERRLKTRMTEAEWQGVEEEFLRTMEAEQAYYQVRFIAVDGMESIRVNNERGRLRLVPRYGLQYKGDRYYFREALATAPGKVYLSPLDFNVENGRIEEPRRLVARVATPVRDDSGRVRGVVVINVFGEEMLGTLARLKPSPGIRVILLDEAARFVEMEEQAGTPHFRAGTPEELGNLRGIGIPAPDTKATGIVRTAGDTLLAAASVHAGPGKVWRLFKIYPRAMLFADITRLHRAIMFLAFPLLLLAAGLAIIAARSFSRPIRELSRFAGDVAAGDYNSRSPIASRDELGELATALNDMAGSLASSREKLDEWNRSLQGEVARKVEELRESEAVAEAARKGIQKLERQLIQADRLASLGMLSATVAHEIGNPLAGLKMRLQMLLRKNAAAEPVRGDLERMLALVDRLAEFLTHLTGYVTPAAGAKARTVDLVRALQELEFILREEADRRHISLSLDLPESPLPVCAPGQHLHQVFMNLILNALQATGERGSVSVAVERAGKTVRTTVRDSGPGLPEGVGEHLFEPLFTTKEQGTGLGLAIVRQLVNEMEGSVTLGNHPAGGAVAEVILPERSGECGDES